VISVTSGHDQGVSVELRDVRTVLLPGTGSDDDYVYRAFAPALHDAGAVALAHTPEPGRLIAGYLDAIEEAAHAGPIVVAGVSLGAAVAAAWAIAHPGRVLAVLAALPPWTGEPDDAPAAAAARQTADELRRDGLGATTTRMQRSSPAWLAAELTRSWVGQWPQLPEALTEAAGYVAPSTAQLATLTAPMGVVSATDDPVHPVEVGVEWVAAAPYASLRTITLDELGADPGLLGANCLAALGDL
jgi:pimeloyl-ACP methyl ester carboxylesterase